MCGLVKNGMKTERAINIQEAIGLLPLIPATGGTRAIGITTRSMAITGFAVVGKARRNNLIKHLSNERRPEKAVSFFYYKSLLQNSHLKKTSILPLHFLNRFLI